MYVPDTFVVDDEAALHDFMRHYGFAVLMTAPEGRAVASHLPILLDIGNAGAILQGHMARANPQWHDFDRIDEALMIFQGPHAYVSPSWYKTSPLVPTWNYAVVHAYGKPVVMEDPSAVRHHLARQVENQEADRDEPWKLDDVPDDFIANMQKGIVAFEMPITRLEGKFKLSQNRNAVDREGACQGLSASDDPDARAVAALMAAVKA